MPATATRHYIDGLFLKPVQVNAPGIAFHLAYHHLAVGLIDGYKVNLVTAILSQ